MSSHGCGLSALSVRFQDVVAMLEGNPLTLGANCLDETRAWLIPGMYFHELTLAQDKHHLPMNLAEGPRDIRHDGGSCRRGLLAQGDGPSPYLSRPR
jgi:hypothetical protein